MPNPLPGTAIRYFGDYLLLGEIASGGMGVVYRARQVKLNRKVALKLIRSGAIASDSEVIRFRTEAEAAARLDHPNIVPLYEIGLHDGQHYVSMKLIEGESLAEQISDGRWKIRAGNQASLQRAIALLLAKVARAVHHAHQRGVLHRDLKPGNLLLDEQGEPHLTDFGLAKLMESDYGQTKSDAVMGTPSYMAPEQAAGKSKHVTTASDLYSLGAIFYELLTGQPPFRGETFVETIDMVQHREPVYPRALNPTVDLDLQTICLKCLEKEPAHRYASAESLAEELERWLRDEPILARPVRLWERGWKCVRRHPATARLCAAIALIFLLGLVGVTWQQHQKEEANVRGRLQSIEVDFGREDTQGALTKLARLLRDRPEKRVAAERLVNALSQRVFLLPSTNAIHFAREAFDSATSGNYRVVIERKVSLRVSDANSGASLFANENAHEKVIRSVRFRPDGARIVTAAGDNTAKIWDRQLRQVTPPLQHAEGVHYAEFSPDGSQVLTASRDQTARLWNATNGQIIGETIRLQNSINIARFSPDGRRIITADDDGVVRIWDARTGRPYSEPVRLPYPVEDASITADGCHIVAFPDRGEGSVFRVTPGLNLVPISAARIDGATTLTSLLRQQLAPKHTGEITFIDLSQDGALIATGCTDKIARLWNARTLALLNISFTHAATVNCVRFSRDGRRLATSTTDQEVRLWDVETGLPLSDWIKSLESVSQVWFSDDDQWLVTSAEWKWTFAKIDGVAPVWLADLAEAVAKSSVLERDLRNSVFGADYLRVRTTLLRNRETNRLAQWAKEFVKDEDQRPKR